uniref:Uncharacterized protein n=1 Tax=Arundo donax TaxID=35708 RepID=A0A0A8Y3S9_ARUDO
MLLIWLLLQIRPRSHTRILNFCRISRDLMV